MNDIEIVQVKVYVPAEVRRMAKVEAAKRDLSMSRFVTTAVREAVARAAATERGE
jgi:post-segregation antitoxin (ccd killing protein)